MNATKDIYNAITDILNSDCLQTAQARYETAKSILKAMYHNNHLNLNQVISLSGQIEQAYQDTKETL